MITVRRSDTGSYVLVHEPSQTVMVGESLEDTFARIHAHVEADPSLPRTPTPTEPAAPRRAWLVGLGMLALLPFLWLGVLHFTLGRMIDELRTAPERDAPHEPIEQLRSELEELRQVVSRVEDEVGQGRAPERASVARPRRFGERLPSASAVADTDGPDTDGPDSDGPDSEAATSGDDADATASDADAPADARARADAIREATRRAARETARERRRRELGAEDANAEDAEDKPPQEP